jgi:hypothetical protein
MSAISCSLGTWPVFSLTRIIERNRIVTSPGHGVAERFRHLTSTTNEDRPNRQSPSQAARTVEQRRLCIMQQQREAPVPVTLQ